MAQFSCPSCNGLMEVGPEHAGIIVACPHCKQHVQIPGGVQGVAPPPPPAFAPTDVRKSSPARQFTTTRETSRRRAGGVSQDSDAVTILVLGIVGLFVCALVSPIAWSMGNTHRRRAQARRQEPNGMAMAGWVMGIIGTILMLLIVVLFGGLFLLGFVGGGRF